MKLLFFLLLLTPLTLTQLLASPLKHNTDSSPQNTSYEDKLGVTLSLPSEKKESNHKPLQYYPYLHAFTPLVGGIIDIKNIQNTKEIIWTLGFSYLFKKYYSPKWEVLMEISSNSLAFLHLSKRWIWNEKLGFRPYIKLGALSKVLPQGGLASFSDFKNYFLECSLGMEDLVTTAWSFRLESNLAISSQNLYFFLKMGYSWGLK
ncbi:MAG: hypothetical protein D6797_08155 [Bdellovibrio sp.]|nr:MAG: hypothetical protein D6797_08155 [Bdellovibrio sp.]